MTRTMIQHYRYRSAMLRFATAGAGVLALGACATVSPPPTQALQAAESAIAHAEDARIVDEASPELADARIKLAQAHDAVQHERMVLAQRLAEQSRVDAELAVANSEVIKAMEINREMESSTEALKQDAHRNDGVRQ